MRLPTLGWGEGNPKTVLLLHGISSNKEGWWRVGPALADLGYHVIAPDLRGHGVNELPGSMTLDDFASDVLDTVETLKICVAYDCEGERITTVPANIRKLELCKPIYEEMPGWQCSTKEVENYDDLPENAKAYVARLCELTDTDVGLLSVGPKRSSTLRIAI